MAYRNNTIQDLQEATPDPSQAISMLPSSLGKCWPGLLRVLKPISFHCGQWELPVLFTDDKATCPEMHGEEITY